MGSHGIAGLTSCHYNFVDFLIALEKNTPKPGVFHLHTQLGSRLVYFFSPL